MIVLPTRSLSRLLGANNRFDGILLVVFILALAYVVIYLKGDENA